MSWNKDNPPTILEKLMSAACYLPMGFFIGVMYILFKGPGCDDRFFRFNFFQSIIVQILITILQMGSESVTGIFAAIIRGVGGAFGGGGVEAVIQAIFMTVHIFVTAFAMLLLYGLIWAILGKYAEIPFISNVVRQNLR